MKRTRIETGQNGIEESLLPTKFCGPTPYPAFTKAVKALSALLEDSVCCGSGGVGCFVVLQTPR